MTMAKMAINGLAANASLISGIVSCITGLPVIQVNSPTYPELNKEIKIQKPNESKMTFPVPNRNGHANDLPQDWRENPTTAATITGMPDKVMAKSVFWAMLIIVNNPKGTMKAS